MFRLALSLGMTVAELGRRMSSAELSEWMAYDDLEPFGESRADLRAGIVASTVARMHGAKASPGDFMPRFGVSDEDRARDRNARMLEKVTAINKMMGGKDLRNADA